MELERASWQRCHLGCALTARFPWKLMIEKYAANSMSKSKVRSYKDYLEKCHEWVVNRDKYGSGAEE